MSSNSKKLAVLASIVLALLLLLPTPAAAATKIPILEGCGFPGFFSRIPTCLVGWSAFAINAILGFVLSIGVTISAKLVGLMLDFNFHVLDPNKNALVFEGWRIVRDIANLGFVLVIIMIAFATILRFREYGMKNLLFKLIAAAILVNFSLAIAGAILDFANVVTAFFLKPIIGGNPLTKPFAIAEAVASAFNPQRFYLQGGTGPWLDVADVKGGFSAFGGELLVLLASILFTNGFLLILIIVLLALAFMFLVRYFWISFLVLLSPITWLFWVVPALRNQWSVWWRKFFQWVFFAPAVSFFIYLALRAQDSLGDVKIIIEGTGFGDLQTIISQGIQMVVLAGILVAGMITAQSMSITGAKAAVGAAEGVGRGTAKYIQNRAARTGQEFSRTRVGQTIASGLQTSKPGLKQLTQMTGLSALGKHMTNVAGAPDIQVGSLMGSVGRGVIKGAGIFQKKAKDYECAHCGFVIKTTRNPMNWTGAITPTILQCRHCHTPTTAPLPPTHAQYWSELPT